MFRMHRRFGQRRFLGGRRRMLRWAMRNGYGPFGGEAMDGGMGFGGHDRSGGHRGRWNPEAQEAAFGPHEREFSDRRGQWGDEGMHAGPRGGGGGWGGHRGGWGPGGGDDDGEGGGGRQRARRGDIKIRLLALIAEQPRHGYELIKVLEERFAGFYRPSPGSVYPTLQYLEDEGYVTSASVGGKRIYTITQAGQEWLDAQQAVASERSGGRSGRRGPGREERWALRQNAMAMMGGIQQVARHGSREQITAVQAILNTATQAIYAVLSGQPTSSTSDE